MTTNDKSDDVRNNPAENRFEVLLKGKTAVSNYRLRDGSIVFTHTEVPPEFEGQGIGNALAKAALNYSRNAGLRVVPLCPFIAAFIKRHSEYQDLVDTGTD